MKLDERRDKVQQQTISLEMKSELDWILLVEKIFNFIPFKQILKIVKSHITRS